MANSLSALCGECCKGMNLRFCSAGHGFKCHGSEFVEEFRRLQAMVGASGCGEATRNVRRGHGCCQRADEVKAMAGAGGESQ